MKILKLHHPTGHPYWQADEYKIEMPDGTIYDLDKLTYWDVPKYARYKVGSFSVSCFRVVVKPDGIYYQLCGASSGSGKTDYKEPFKLIDKSEYDTIEYVGEPLVMSNSLINDLKDNQIKTK